MDPTFFHIQISFFVFKTLKAFFARSKVKITATAAIAIAVDNDRFLDRQNGFHSNERKLCNEKLFLWRQRPLLQRIRTKVELN